MAWHVSPALELVSSAIVPAVNNSLPPAAHRPRAIDRRPAVSAHSIALLHAAALTAGDLPTLPRYAAKSS
jgi:hypothetical protein